MFTKPNTLTEGNYLTRANVLAPQLKELREAVRRIRRVIPPPGSEPDRYEVNYDWAEGEQVEQSLAFLPAELTLGWREPGIWKFRRVGGGTKTKRQSRGRKLC